MVWVVGGALLCGVGVARVLLCCLGGWWGVAMWFVECRHRATVSFVFFRVEEEAVRRQRCFCCGSEVFLCDSRVKQEHGLGVKLCYSACDESLGRAECR